MRALKVMIAEDEALARRRLERLLRSISGVVVCGSHSSGAAVLDAIAEEPVDVLFLDVQMPGLSGLDAGAMVPSGGPRVVFVTAHPEHALEAFGVGAEDYLLKPVDAARLVRCVSRLRERLVPAVGEDSEAPLALPTRRGIRLVARREVRYAVFDGTALIVHTATEQLFVEWTLSELHRRLPDPPFLRVHRRVLVHLGHVTWLEKSASGGYLARLDTGQEVAVSRQVARDLRKRWGLAGRRPG